MPQPNLTRSLAEVFAKIEQTKRVVPKLVANQTQNYFVMSFKKQGFDGKAWKEVNRRIPDTKEYKYPQSKGLARRSRPILIGETGQLRRKVANSIVVASWPTVKLMVDLPYAAVHNDGNSKTPQRQYIGQTKELTEIQAKTIEKNFDKIWK